jgi:S1-C subfamily serine protease
MAPALTAQKAAARKPESVPVMTAAALRITVALVTSDMTVRVIPLHAMRLTAESDSTWITELRTALDGTATATVPPGRYMLKSSQPVALNDSLYEWNVPVEVGASGRSLELTNANAIAVYKKKAIARQVAPEREVFDRVKRGEFRIEAGLASGSGFLAQMPGGMEPMIVTNDHVVENDTAASVYLDSVTRVPAVVVVRDRDADIAILRLPKGRCGDCPALTMASPNAGEPLVVAGERVLAIGFPLHQQMTLTTGIASSIRDGANITDVNINHGNSGGPMLNLAGEVIGINAFGDFTSQGGPGISGAITITRVSGVLERLPAAYAAVAAPPDRTLPSMPQSVYPNALLKLVADSLDPKAYRKLLAKDAGVFTLNITTPVLSRVFQRLAENEVAGDRRNREKQGNVSKDEVYSEDKQVKDWDEYVGDDNTPVVAISIAPKIAETGGSMFLRILAASGGAAAQASMVFQGDVRGAHFYRNGVEVEPLRGGHGPQVARIEDRWVKLKDVADYGYYVLPPEAFAPDSTGAPARVRITIADLKNPGFLSDTEIEGRLSANLWNDFHAYYSAVYPDKPWIEADPGKRSPKVKMECEPTTAVCTMKSEGKK